MKHLKENNETYLSHLKFAGKIGIHLLLRGVVFIFHALLPICEVPKSLDLKSTSGLFIEWNDYSHRRKK